MERVVADVGVRAPFADGPVIQVAMSQETSFDLLAAVFAEQIQELLARSCGRGRGAAHTSRPVSWSTTTVRYR